MQDIQTDNVTSEQIAAERRDAYLRSQQEALAVDENDPRVLPHREALEVETQVDAETLERNKAAIDAARAGLDDARAQLAAAIDLEKAAQERTAEARAEYQRRAEALAGLAEPLSKIAPAAHLAPGEPTELMFFPHAVTVNTGLKQATFPAGIHPVPESIQLHWWLLANGVRPYRGSVVHPTSKTRTDERVVAQPVD